MSLDVVESTIETVESGAASATADLGLPSISPYCDAGQADVSRWGEAAGTWAQQLLTSGQPAMSALGTGFSSIGAGLEQADQQLAADAAQAG
jgi:hypothetical protein